MIGNVECWDFGRGNSMNLGGKWLGLLGNSCSLVEFRGIAGYKFEEMRGLLEVICGEFEILSWRVDSV